MCLLSHAPKRERSAQAVQDRDVNLHDYGQHVIKCSTLRKGSCPLPQAWCFARPHSHRSALQSASLLIMMAALGDAFGALFSSKNFSQSSVWKAVYCIPEHGHLRCAVEPGKLPAQARSAENTAGMHAL